MRRLATSLCVLLLAATVAAGQSTVSGTASISVAVLGITRSPTNLSFPSQIQGTTSASQPVTVLNSGGGTVNITSIGTTAQFGQTNNCPAAIDPNVSCTINVTFTPTTTGAISGTLSITDNAPGSPHTVALSGTGTASSPVVSLNPTSLTFGSQLQGTSSGSQPVTLQNTGGSALTITSIVAPAQYSQTNNCPGSLAPTLSCTINVTFSPTSVGTITGNVTITDNAAGSPHTIFVTGTGTSAGGGAFAHLPQAVQWSTIPNTFMSDVCACTHGFPGACGNDGSGVCQNVFNWSGGGADTNRMRLLVFGGGHTDSSDNSLYSLRLDTNPVSFVRQINPTTQASCADTATGGGPQSRHTYGGLNYISTTDEFFVTGGSMAIGCGSEANDVWTLAMGTNAWTKRCGSGNVCGYNNGLNGKWAVWDPNTNDVFTSDRDFKYRYNATTHILTRVGSTGLSGYYTGAADPPRKRIYVVGDTIAYVNVDPSSGTYLAETNVPGGSCSFGRYSGVAYDSSRQMIVIYTSGANIGEINATNPAAGCTVVNPGGTTPAALHDSSMGILGRFQYFPPPVNAFIAIPRPNGNVSILRRQVPLNEIPFATRCAQPGVVVCAGMNSQSEINAQIESTGTFPVTFDSSGTSCAVPEGMAGSARFQTNGSVNAGGTLRWAFGPYGNNTTFYFSFRQCWDSNFGNRTFAGSEPHFKHFIMFNQSTASCTDSQFVMENSYNRGLPQFYRSCSAPDLIIQTTDGDHALQWGVEGTHGPDNGPNNSFIGTVNPSQGTGWYRTRRNDDPGENNGLMYSNVIGQWITFYCKVTTGTHGTPSSRLDCWSNVAGQNLKQQVALGQINWLTDTGGSNFGHIDIGPYITSGTAGSGAVGSTWYSQLIISTQPITPPTGPTP